MAGYLFILAIEVLLLKLFASKNITPWTSKKNLQMMAEGYADDLKPYIKSMDEFSLLDRGLTLLDTHLSEALDANHRAHNNGGKLGVGGKATATPPTAL